MVGKRRISSKRGLVLCYAKREGLILKDVNLKRHNLRLCVVAKTVVLEALGAITTQFGLH